MSADPRADLVDGRRAPWPFRVDLDDGAGELSPWPSPTLDRLLSAASYSLGALISTAVLIAGARHWWHR